MFLSMEQRIEQTDTVQLAQWTLSERLEVCYAFGRNHARKHMTDSVGARIGKLTLP
jgi:hypothetical protein